MKICFITVAIALASTTVFANISVGAKGGLSLFKAQNDQSISTYNEFRQAPDISVFCAFDANKFLVNNILLTYYQAGGKTTIQATDGNGNLSGKEFRDVEKLNYIGIGYSLGFNMKILNLIPSLSAGISLDYLVNAKEEIVYDNNVEESHLFDDSKFRKFSARPFLTAALEYKINKIGLLAEYTFSYNILPYYEAENTSNIVVKYRTFGQFLNLGFKFYL